MTKLLATALVCAFCTVNIGCREQSGSMLLPQSSEHHDEGNSVPATEEVISIQYLGPRYEPAEQVIAQLSTGGELRCSENEVFGGPSLSTRTLSEPEIAELLDQIDNLVPPGLEAMNHSIPSGHAIEMRFDLPSGRSVVWRSSHVIYEQDPRVVATARGIETLTAMNREAVLQSQPKEYREFRQAWRAIATLLRDYCEGRQGG